MALRIKPNVDLKELEKYGFKRMKNHFYKCKRSSYSKDLKMYGMVILGKI